MAGQSYYSYIVQVLTKGMWDVLKFLGFVQLYSHRCEIKCSQFGSCIIFYEFEFFLKMYGFIISKPVQERQTGVVGPTVGI